ncbi:Transcriptional regulator, LysR family [hydrothermal vent metagenome]|uniref:Transcriptional regulator, LysR family n=1 Tax=hydrothermal vent metagenome TaxID=652676 RepID=A0A3B0YTQ9_9ZZZZ
MDIAVLKAFIAVADNRSFSLAAEQLFLTQPAISKRVATLENELETRLFDRIGRGVSLTEAGQALLPRARNILLELEDSVRALSNLSGEVHGTLRFGTSHHIGLHRLPPVLKDFVSAYPNVRLDIRFMDSEAACLAVEQGELELAIVTLPPAPAGALQLKKIWDDPLAVVVANDHPLAHKRRVSLKELARHPVILPAMGTYTRQIAETAFRNIELQLDIALSTNYLETIHMLVSVGIGWSLLPVTMQDSQTKILTVDALSLNRSLGIVHHRERTLSNAAYALTRLLDMDTLNLPE